MTKKRMRERLSFLKGQRKAMNLPLMIQAKIAEEIIELENKIKLKKQA